MRQDTSMRESPKAFSTTRHREIYDDTQGNDLEHSKNEKDWVIRRVTI